MGKALVVEDDATVASAIGELLEAVNLSVDIAYDGEDGLYRLTHSSYDIAIVDWHLPGISGGEMCSRYRQRGGQTAIIMLTNRDKTSQKVEGLELGADDYLTKPFDCNELVARVRALLRRPPMLLEKRIEKTGVQLDYKRCTVLLNGKSTKLLPKEFEVLEFLLKYSDGYFTADELIKHLWSSESEVGPETVRVCISRIRSKVDRKEYPSLIETSKGWGYKISEFYLSERENEDETSK